MNETDKGVLGDVNETCVLVRMNHRACERCEKLVTKDTTWYVGSAIQTGNGVLGVVDHMSRIQGSSLILD